MSNLSEGIRLNSRTGLQPWGT